jgi:transposase
MAYSRDLKIRVVEAAEQGEYTQPELATLFKVSQSSVEKWLSQYRQGETFESQTHRCGRTRALSKSDVHKEIRKAVSARPDATLGELCEQVKRVRGVKSTKSMMCRELKRLGLRRKKDLRSE